MSDSDASNILVLDANQRSALAVTRSLGRRPEVNVWTADCTHKSLAGASRYSQHYLQCPSPQNQPTEFLLWLSDMIRLHRFDVVFPVTEITSQLLLMNHSYLGSCKLPFADYQTVMSLADKGKLMQAAVTAGVPTPKFSLYQQADEVDIEDFDTFPIVIKPCLSKVWSGKEWISTGVTIVHDRDALRKTLDDKAIQACPFMIQSYIDGHGAGLFALYNRGHCVASFAHARIREKPPWGGVSVVSESVAMNEPLKQYAEALLGSVGWHGVAMVEFRVGLDGTPYLMEVNTRFWGSLQLAIDSGVDFPYLLWQVCHGEANAVHGPYRIGQRLRWLLGDLDSLYLALRDSRYNRREKLRALINFFRPGSGRHEINRWDDLAPAVQELRAYVAGLRGRSTPANEDNVDPDWLSEKR